MSAHVADPANVVFISTGHTPRLLQQWFGRLPVGLVAEHGFFYRLPRRPHRRHIAASPMSPLPHDLRGGLAPADSAEDGSPHTSAGGEGGGAAMGWADDHEAELEWWKYSEDVDLSWHAEVRHARAHVQKS